MYWKHPNYCMAGVKNERYPFFATLILSSLWNIIITIWLELKLSLTGHVSVLLLPAVKPVAEKDGFIDLVVRIDQDYPDRFYASNIVDWPQILETYVRWRKESADLNISAKELLVISYLNLLSYGSLIEQMPSKVFIGFRLSKNPQMAENLQI